MSRDNERSQHYWKEPPKETSYEAHLRRKRLKQQQRSRPSKSQASTTGQDQGDRLSQGDRVNRATRPPEGVPTMHQPKKLAHDSVGSREVKSGREGFYGSSSEDAYEIESDLPSGTLRRRSRPIGDTGSMTPVVRGRQVPGKTTRHLPKARRRRAWTWVLAGCAGGILTIALIVAIILVIFFRTTLGSTIFGGIFNQTFTQKNQQQFAISNFSLIQVDNKVGNITSDVTIVVDPTATVTTLTTLKKVQAGNTNDANNQFARIPLIVAPVNPAMPTLILTICGQVSTTCGNIGATVDVTITLPSSTNANGSYLLDVETRAGNVGVQQAKLAAGSCLSTNNGDVTFKGTFDTTNSSDLNPCGEPTNNPHPWYKFHSEVGNLDITQLPVTKNVLLDASTTSGKINTNDFALKIETSNGSATYYGPLIPNAPQPTAELTLDVGTGDIDLHRI